jgi:hypothetical protein
VISSRPRYGDAIGTDSKGGRVILTEQFEKFLDELTAEPQNAAAVNGDQTPSVANYGQRGILSLENTAPTNVTGLDDGFDTQEIVLLTTNGNTTLVNSAGFRLSGGVNVNPPANSTLVMKLDGDTWRQVAPVVTT